MGKEWSVDHISVQARKLFAVDPQSTLSVTAQIQLRVQINNGLYGNSAAFLVIVCGLQLKGGYL